MLLFHLFFINDLSPLYLEVSILHNFFSPLIFPTSLTITFSFYFSLFPSYIPYLSHNHFQLLLLSIPLLYSLPLSQSLSASTSLYFFKFLFCRADIISNKYDNFPSSTFQNIFLIFTLQLLLLRRLLHYSKMWFLLWWRCATMQQLLEKERER